MKYDTFVEYVRYKKDKYEEEAGLTIANELISLSLVNFDLKQSLSSVNDFKIG